MQDAWRAYLELAFGLTEASRKKAREVAREVLGRSGATAAQLQAFVDDLVATGRTNREGLSRLVRYEVERALGAVGLATAEEVADLTTRLRGLEQRLGQADSGPVTAGAVPAAGGRAGPEPAPAGKPQMAKQAVAKKAMAKKPVEKKPVVKKAVAKKAVAKKVAGQPGAQPGTGRKATT